MIDYSNFNKLLREALEAYELTYKEKLQKELELANKWRDRLGRYELDYYDGLYEGLALAMKLLEKG